MPFTIPFANRTNRIASLATISLAVLTLIGTPVLAANKYEKTVSETIPVEDARQIVIKSKSGDIVVIGDARRVDVLLKVIKRVKAEDQEEAERLADMMNVEVSRADGEIKIETKYPKQKELRKSIFSYILQRGPSMDMEIHCTVPVSLELDVKTASGEVTISKMAAPVEVAAASGDIDVSEIKGPVTVGVASGDIEAADIKGSINFNSSSGDIVVKRVAGDAVVETSSGDIQISEIAGDLDLNTASGDATIDGVGSVSYRGVSGTGKFLEVRGGVSATAASGDLTFQLLPENDFDYSVRTSSGDIKLRFLKKMIGGFILKAGTTTGDMSANLAITISKVGRNHIAGIVRDGRSKVVLETASGDIVITEPEE
ncbi:MAG: DUF4097 family beta strand repeat protein [bacterium]|nr:MAG: DUF4097 family beta strand repeat protein [bacterium]